MTISVDTKALDKQFDTLSKTVQNKIGKKAIMAGIKATAKAIKREVPSNLKGIRKAIGYSFKKPRSGKLRNVIFAKAGAGAGMKKQKRAKLNAADANKKRKRGGVGISVANAHWFLMGTENRFTGSKRIGAHKRGAKNKRKLTGGKVRFTGRMKRSGIVQKAEASSRSAVAAIIRGTFLAEISKQLAKQ